MYVISNFNGYQKVTENHFIREFTRGTYGRIVLIVKFKVLTMHRLEYILLIEEGPTNW